MEHPLKETAVDDPEDLVQTIQEAERQKRELAQLFGRETVDLAGQIDIVDLNLNEKMTECIADGVRRLKELKGDPAAQARFIESMEQGARLVLCMWIMDMGLLDRIRDGPGSRV
jgi:hypothetical protein